MMKRTLALLLVLVMVLSVLPVGVIAEGGEYAPLAEHTDEGHICEHCENTAQWTAWDGTETMTDGGHYVLGDDVTLSAPVALSAGTYVLCLNGQTLTGATTLFDLSGTASLIITDCTAKTEEDVYTAGTLTGATASAVRVADTATFTMHDGVFTGNTNSATTTTEGGGAVNASENAVVKLLGGELQDNSAGKYGGAVFARNYAKITIQNMLITGNETQVASALYGTGGVEYTIIDSVITGNTGTHTSTTNAGYAAAVHMSGSTVKLTVSGKVVIADNIVKSGNTKVADLVFAKNTDKLYVNALSEGSHIVFSTPAITISDADLSKVITVSGTQSTWNPHWVSYMNASGGTESVSMTGTNKFMAGHYHGDQLYTAISTNAQLNTLEGYGYLTNDLKLGGAQTRKKNATVCLNGHTVTAKKDARIFTTDDHNITFTIQDCTGYTDENGVYHAGKLTGGANKDSGGAILIAEGNTFNLEGGILTGNTCLAAGGAIQIKGGTFNMSGGEISGNKPVNAEGATQNAGAILIAEGGTFNMTGGKITGNEGANGGAIYIAKGTMNMTGGEVCGNTASVNGGGVYVAANGTLNISGGKLCGNEAGTHGGAVYTATNSGFTMTGGEISNNKAANSGGGLYLLKQEAVISNATISGNTAGKAGGAAFFNGTTVTLTDVTVTGNESVNGGGIYHNAPATANPETGADEPYPCALTMGGASTFSGNKATTNGGGVYVYHENITVTLSDNVNVTGNEGGNLYLDSMAMLNLQNIGTDAKVGISVAASQRAISSELTEDLSAQFPSDNKNCEVIFQNNALFIKVNTDHIHCVCYGADSSCDHAKVEYIPWEKTDSLPTAGNYYLTDDVTLTAEASVTGNLSLCLNGFTVKAAENHRILSTAAGDITLVISDCTAKTENGVYTAGKLTGGYEKELSGGGIYLRAGSTMKLYDGIITGNRSDSFGGGISVTKDSALEIYGGEIDRNTTAGNGAGVYAATDSKFVMTGGSIKNNIADGNGGGVYLVKITTELTGGEIANNEAKKDGGALYLNGTVITMENVTISGNKAAANGGAIYANNPVATDAVTGEKTPYPANITLNEGAKIVGNESATAGGIYINRSNLTMNGGAISENVSQATAGAVYVSVDSTMTLNGGALEKNSAASNGGAIYAATGSAFSMTGGSVKGNTSGSNGGGLYLLKIETTFEGGEIIGNEANEGGGMYCNGTTVTFNKLTISGNKATAGAGIYAKTVTSENADGQSETFPAMLTLSKDTIIKNNNASKNGGGICITGKDAVLEMPAGTVSGNYGKNAGGVLIMGKATFKMTGGSISGNSANSGGGVYVSSNCTMQFGGGSISGNTSAKNGGGIYMLRSTCNLNGGVISGNKGESGGGFYVSGATVNLTGTTISGNEAVKNGGGAMVTVSSVTTNGVKDVAYGKINMTGGLITENTAINAGGLIVQSKGCEINLKGGKLINNTATSTGGAMYISTNGTLNMSGGEVTNNTAKASGGIHHNKSIGNYTGGLVAFNKAATGGGMSMGGGETCVVTIEKLTVQGNEAERAGGGILQQGNSQLILGAAEIFDNVSGKIGGGLCISSKTNCVMDGTIFRNNTGKTEGGAFYVYTASSATCTNLTVEGNHAVNTGGGIFSRGRLILKDSAVTGNTSDGNGGGIGTYRVGTNRIGKSSYMTLENVDIKDNTADGLGGGVYLSLGHPAEMKNVTVTGNKAAAEGGGIWSACHLSMDGLTVTGNQSGGAGYAVYLEDSKYDGQSFVRGVLKMGGDMIVKDNPGGDMYLGDTGTISIPGGYLGENSYVHIQLYDGLLTQQVVGFYNYEGGDLDYIITAGSRSVTDPEAAQTQDDEPVEDPTAPGDEIKPGEDNKLSGALIAGIGGIVVVVVAAAVLIAVLAKKKKPVQK